MPKQVDHADRRQSIARALWRVVDERGWSQATLRAVAEEANVSLGQLQHYFASRQEMLQFAMSFAAEQTSERVSRSLVEADPHPRDVLRIAVLELLPLRSDSRAMSRLNAAFVLEALHNAEIRRDAASGLRDGRAMVEALIHAAMEQGLISRERNAATETNRVLALTGLAPLIELDVVTPEEAVAAVDDYLDELFTSK